METYGVGDSLWECVWESCLFIVRSPLDWPRTHWLPRLISSLRLSCYLCLLNVGITGISHYSWLFQNSLESQSRRLRHQIFKILGKSFNSFYHFLSPWFLSDFEKWLEEYNWIDCLAKGRMQLSCWSADLPCMKSWAQSPMHITHAERRQETQKFNPS